jgi:hypothetical protein
MEALRTLMPAQIDDVCKPVTSAGLLVLVL